MKTSRMMMSGLFSAIFLTAAAPLLTATTSYPASVRIFLPMFWAVMLSSAKRILIDTRAPSKAANPLNLTWIGPSVNEKTIAVTYSGIASSTLKSWAKRASTIEGARSEDLSRGAEGDFDDRLQINRSAILGAGAKMPFSQGVAGVFVQGVVYSLEHLHVTYSPVTVNDGIQNHCAFYAVAHERGRIRRI